MRSLRAEILKSWLTDRDIQDLGEGEIRAVIDALALAIYADFEVNPEEEVEFDNLTSALPRPEDGSDRAPVIAEAKAEAAKVESEESLHKFVDSVATRLPESAYEKVYAMIVTIAVADRELLPDEEVVLAVFADAFGIGDDRAGVIYKGTLKALGLQTDEP